MKNNKIGRIKAIILRHMRVWVVNWSRLSDSLYWPPLALILWGYVSVFLADQGGSPNLLIVFLAGFIFWNIMQRSQEEMCMGFMEDLWNRNFTNIFATPISLWEYLIAITIVGLIKLTFSTILVALIAVIVFQFNLLTIGIYLIPFIFSLMIVGWWVGFIINGLVFRFGYDVEALSWTLIFILQPFSGVFYPIRVLPGWMQIISRFIPSTYIFEGLRMLVFKGEVDGRLIFMSYVLNAIYFSLSILFFKKMFDIARDKGYLTKIF